MRRIWLAFGLALALAPFAQATEDCSAASGRPEGKLPVCLALDAVTTATESSAVKAAGYSRVIVQVYSAAGSTSTVYIKVRESASAPWFIVATITDAGTSGETWGGPAPYQLLIDADAVTAGAVTAYVSRYTSPN